MATYKCLFQLLFLLFDSHDPLIVRKFFLFLEPSQNLYIYIYNTHRINETDG